MLSDEQIFKMAVKFGADMSNKDFDRVEFYIWEIVKFYKEIEQAARREAFTEAANLCEKIGDDYYKSDCHKYPEMKDDAQTGCGSCENEIRDLITKEQQNVI